jgi:hypothetical protein
MTLEYVIKNVSVKHRNISAFIQIVARRIMGENAYSGATTWNLKHAMDH